MLPPWAWRHLVRGRQPERATPLYLAELLSHRSCATPAASSTLTLLPTSVALVAEGRPYQAALAAQPAWLGLAAAGAGLPVPGAGLAYYYPLVRWATLASLVRYLREGAPPIWEKAEGTR